MAEDSRFRVLIDIINNVVGAGKIKEQTASLDKLTLKQQAIQDVMNRANVDAKRATDIFRTLGVSFDKAGNPIDAFGNQVKLTNKQLAVGKAQTEKFQMGWLSVLFTMMAVKRVLEGFLRSAITTYEKAYEKQSAFSKQTEALRGAWEFFKYSLIDALSQSEIFTFIINLLFQIVNWLNQLSPAAKKILILGVIFGIVVSSLFFVIATLMLFVNGLASISPAVLAAFGTFFFVLAVIALLLGGILLIISGFKEILDNWGKDWAKVGIGIVKVVSGIILVLLGILLVIGVITIGWALAIAAIVAILAFGVVWIIKHWDQVHIGFINLVASLKIAWEYFASFMVTLIQVSLKFLYGLFADFVEGILSWVRMIPGVGKSIANALTNGLEAGRSAIDAWGNSITSFRDNNIAGINRERDAQIEAIYAAQKAKADALTESVNSSAPSNSAGLINSSSGSTQNITKIETINLDVTSNSTDNEDIASQVMEKLNGEISKYNGSI